MPETAWRCDDVETCRRPSRKRIFLALRLFLTLLISACFVSYVGSYYALSRLSLQKLRGTEVEGFYYVPCRVESLRNRKLQGVHHTLVIVFYPVWACDHYLMNGPAVAGIPMYELSDPGGKRSTRVDGRE